MIRQLEQAEIRQFMIKMGQTVRTIPTTNIPQDEKALRIRLLREEVEEFAKAVKENNLVEIADALADIQYVLSGAANTFGIDLASVYDEVHKSNMDKLWENGMIHKDEGGKVIKPPNWQPPDIKTVLRKLGADI